MCKRTSENTNIHENKQKLNVKSYESFRRRRRSVYQSQIQITTSIHNATFQVVVPHA